MSVTAPLKLAQPLGSSGAGGAALLAALVQQQHQRLDALAPELSAYSVGRLHLVEEVRRS